MTREKGATIPKKRVVCAKCGHVGHVPMFYIWYNGTHGVSPDLYLCDLHHYDAKMQKMHANNNDKNA